MQAGLLPVARFEIASYFAQTPIPTVAHLLCAADSKFESCCASGPRKNVFQHPAGREWEPEMQTGRWLRQGLVLPPSNKEEDRVPDMLYGYCPRDRTPLAPLSCSVQRAAQNDNRAGDIRPDRVGPVNNVSKLGRLKLLRYQGDPDPAHESSSPKTSISGYLILGGQFYTDGSSSVGQSNKDCPR